MVSNAILPSRFGLAALAAALLLLLPCLQTRAEEFRSPSDGIYSMTYEAGRLSLDARDASLDKLLKELARMAMLTVVSDAPIEGQVTVYADRLPLEKALRKILRGKDTSFVYTAAGGTSPPEYEVAEVRLYLAKGGDAQPQRYSYADRRGEAEADRAGESRRSRERADRSGNRGPGPRPPNVPPLPPDLGMDEEAQRFISAIMEGDYDGLDAIAEKLNDQDPQVKEQLEALMKSMEEARMRAEESGFPVPSSLEELGGMDPFMREMLQGGRLAPDEEPETE